MASLDVYCFACCLVVKSASWSHWSDFTPLMSYWVCFEYIENIMFSSIGIGRNLEEEEMWFEINDISLEEFLETSLFRVDDEHCAWQFEFSKHDSNSSVRITAMMVV